MILSYYEVHVSYPCRDMCKDTCVIWASKGLSFLELKTLSDHKSDFGSRIHRQSDEMSSKVANAVALNTSSSGRKRNRDENECCVQQPEGFLHSE